jgi:phosphatidylinositol 4-kinase
MTSTKKSYDQDDRSIDTVNTNRSNNSELYLARIQEETNRLRQKRKERRDSAESSTGHSRRNSAASATLSDPEQELFLVHLSDDDENENEHETKSSTASSQQEKSSSTTRNSPQASSTTQATTSLVSSSFESKLSTTPAKIPWSETFDSSERSHQSSDSHEKTNNTTHASVSSRSAHSIILTQTVVEEQEEDEEKTESDWEDPSDFLVIQRGDSITENSQFEDPVTSSTTTRSSSSPSKLNFPFSALTPRKKPTMTEELERKKDDDFRKTLIDEVLGKDDGDKVSMEKVMMIIWQFREDKDVIKFMTRFVTKFAGSREIFDGIEFYLPQLAHMMIHLETEWDDAILERFTLVIAQQSIHFALQLNWILAGAIEDYQPELPDGNANPTYNPLYYFRCVKLLTNIERCVVYRRPRSQELQRLYEKGNITKQEMHSLEQADRRFTAMQITAPEDDAKEIFGGTLKYKRAVRSSHFKFKRWKNRYFAIEERMLNCYNTDGGTLVRSMPLEGASIQVMNTKYPNMFSVTNRSFEFRIRASSSEDQKKWIMMLQSEAKTGRVFGHTDASLFVENTDAQRVIDELTPSQRERYMFYRNEREFVRRLTDIAEDLRFEEPCDRKKAAPGLLKDLEIPSNAYSPLMSSTDIFRRIHSTIFEDTRVFNTKARCPTVMYFLGVRGEFEYKGERHANMDIAEYIYLQFDANQDGADGKNPEVTTNVTENGEKDIEVELDSERAMMGKIEEGNEIESTSAKLPESNLGYITPKGDNDQSFVWSESLMAETPGAGTTPNKRAPKGHGSPTRANRYLRKFLRESMVSVPRNLARHLEKKGSRHSHVRSISKTSRNSSSNSIGGNVPIAMGHASRNHGLGEDVYIGRSSVMDQSHIIKGRVNAGDIDQESLNRAKTNICGGQSWAEKSFQMLENVKDKPKDTKCQLEIVCLLSKSNDDLRQEVFVMQMIHYYKSVFIAAELPLWLKTYKILSTSSSTGLLEFMVDSTSLDGLKKSEYYPKEGGLRRYFEETYGGPDSKSFKAAQRNFVQSLAAYSIVCYLLGLKDRHNGNIMIDMRGHLVHIDYGFCFGMCVGHEFTMERAPFKLTEEYVEVMGGFDGEPYQEFQRLFVEGMIEARSKCQIALGLVEIMMYQSNYPCFSGRRYGGNQALKGFRERLMLDVPDNEVESRARGLIQQARNHWGTRAYDSFQQWSNGYAI